MNNKKDSEKNGNDAASCFSELPDGGTGYYYAHQDKARRVVKPEDAIRLCDEMSSVWNNILCDVLPQDKSAKIYEAGCGSGAFLLFLKNLGYTNIEGSDFSANQVEIARANQLNVRLADSVLDIESREPETFDCIVAIDFIEHLDKGKAMRFLSACGRALKKGGNLVLRMPNGDSPFVGRNLFNDITHQWAYTTISMRALLEIAGFSNVEFKDETEASVKCLRLIKVPLIRFSQWLIKGVIRTATREQIQYLSPSIFVFAKK